MDFDLMCDYSGKPIPIHLAKWKSMWKGMPEFIQEDLQAEHSIKINFMSLDDFQEFKKLLNQSMSEKTKSVWFPAIEQDRQNLRYVADKRIENRYPIYIISKGRWDTRLTSKSLERMQIPYHIVIEPQEYDDYAAVIDPEKILVLPFSNLGKGSIPARNWVWEHSIERGFDRHWILDDNIAGFCRLNRNEKLPVDAVNMFAAAEDFTDRYENVALSGLNYRFFAVQRAVVPPFYTNTRIYSCILIQNSLPFRWRGRYNEDTDLSLRVLKSGLCTILFNAFLCNKTGTMIMKGGNTDELYQDDGRLLMAQSLQKQHPDVVRIVKKWNRWQHHVDYTPFAKNKLRLKKDVVLSDTIDNYGMKLRVVVPDKSDSAEIYQQTFF